MTWVFTTVTQEFIIFIGHMTTQTVQAAHDLLQRITYLLCWH